MAAEWICDGCGKREPGVATRMGRWIKPSHWFERSDNDGIQSACCKKCIDKIAATSGKTSLVLPI